MFKPFDQNRWTPSAIRAFNVAFCALICVLLVLVTRRLLTPPAPTLEYWAAKPPGPLNYWPPSPAKPPEAWGSIRVVDEETGLVVPGATVSWLEEHAEERATRLMPLPPLATSGEFRYEGPSGVVLFHVTASGYVSSVFGERAAEVPPGKGFAHEFRLERAGGIGLQFSCDGRPVTPKGVRLLVPRRSTRGGLTAVGFAVNEGYGERYDLEEGIYGIEVEPGPEFEPVETQYATIRKAELTQHAFELVRQSDTSEEHEEMEVVTGAVRGTVRFHAAWGDRTTFVRFLGTGFTDGTDRKVVPTRKDSGGPLRFDFGRLPEGDYWIEVQPQWRTFVSVVSDGSEFHLEVPEPARVRVRVLEDSIGKPILGSRLTWHCLHERLNQYTMENESPDPKSGAFSFQVPPGEVEFDVTAQGWIPFDGGTDFHNGAKGRVHLQSGESSDHIVRLRPGGSIRTLVRCDGTPLTKRLVDVVLTIAEETDGNRAGSVSYSLNGGPGLFRRGELPTVKYTLTIEDPRRMFQPVPERDIQIHPGQVTELTVDLTRRE